METFHPTAFRAGDVVDGAFVIDLFYYVETGDGCTSNCLPRVLEYIKACFRLTFMAVGSGGAALSRPSGKRAATFEQMLPYLPEGGVRFLIAVVCGNDWYGMSVRHLATDVMDAAASFCDRMRGLSQHQCVVVGGSPETWDYERCGMSAACMERCDENACALSRCFNSNGVRTCTGAEELRGVEIADGLGHITASSVGVSPDPAQSRRAARGPVLSGRASRAACLPRSGQVRCNPRSHSYHTNTLTKVCNYNNTLAKRGKK